MLLPFFNGLTLTNPFDPECAILADRHYSRQTIGSPQFAGCGRKIILRDANAQVLFVWIYSYYRLDGLDGYYCSIFRNESERLSSEIILEAEHFAVYRWGSGRAFTFIDATAIRSRNPGYCFKKAGWRFVGYSSKRQQTYS
jgi:hypothetical protein